MRTGIFLEFPECEHIFSKAQYVISSIESFPFQLAFLSNGLETYLAHLKLLIHHT
jgi:hypothetical protein